MRKPYKRVIPKRIGARYVRTALTAIDLEHFNRRSSKAHKEIYEPTKNETRKNFLRREIYALGRALIDSKSNINWTKMLNDHRLKTYTRPDSLDNIFHILFLLFRDEDLNITRQYEDINITRQERSNMAKELLYAHRHSIPEELLVGFIYQSGPRSDLPKKLEDEDYLEPAFRIDRS